MKNQEEVVVQLLLHYHFPINNKGIIEDEELFDECERQFRQAIGILEEYLSPLKLNVEVISKEKGCLQVWLNIIANLCTIISTIYWAHEKLNKAGVYKKTYQSLKRVTSWFVESFFRFPTTKEIPEGVRDDYDQLQELLSACRNNQTKSIDELFKDSRLKKHRRKFFESAEKKKDMTHIEITIHSDCLKPIYIVIPFEHFDKLSREEEVE
jgi:hypothetical protein